MMKFYVVGHDNSARAARRANTHRPRFLRFGNDFVVRPKRRVEIATAILLKHADAVVDAIRKGIITLQSATDTNVTVEEFLALRPAIQAETAQTALEGAETASTGEPETSTATEPTEPPAGAQEPESGAAPETPVVEPMVEPAAVDPAEDTQAATPAEEPAAPEAPPPVVEKELPDTKQNKKGRR